MWPYITTYSRSRTPLPKKKKRLHWHPVQVYAHKKNANLCCQKAPVAAYIDPEKSDLRSSSGEEMKRATLR
jgi:hypothetical protein